MNACPPNPGLTDITRTKSRSRGDIVERRDRGGGIDHRSRLHPATLDVRNRSVQVRRHLDVDRQHVCAGFSEIVDESVGFRNHQMDVEWTRRDLLERANHRCADGDIGDEVPVHDVNVDQVGPPALHRGDIPAQMREVRRQDGRSNLHTEMCHRLTSSEIESDGPT